MTTLGRRFANLTVSEVAAELRADSILVLPTGAIEPHGPHLPLATDLIIAEAVAGAVVDRGAAAGHDVWLMPALAYTKSDEHALLPGALWLHAETLLDTLVDLGAAIAETPARRVLFINAHGGNAALLQVACRELRRRFDLRTFMTAGGSPEHSAPEEHGLGVHAGWAETSLMLYLRDDLVDMTRAVAHPATTLAAATWIGFDKPVQFGWLSTDFDPSGVVGDPTGATAEAGRELFDQRVETLVAALSEIATFDPKEPA